MSYLLKKLNDWRSKDLLTETQLQAILNYENSLPKDQWGLIGVLALGVGILILGIVAIIASNWEAIPASIKLAMAFLLLFVIAYEIIKDRNDESILVSDGLKAFFALFCMAVIGLIAQIYNLHGDTYKTGLLWSLMTILLISDAKNIFVPLFWTFIFSASLLTGLYEHPAIHSHIKESGSFFILLITLGALISRRLLNKSPFRNSAEYFTLGVWIFGLCLSSARLDDRTQSIYEFANFVPHYAISLLIMAALLSDPAFKKLEKNVFIAGLVVANILFSFNYMASEQYLLLIVGSILCLLAWAFYFLSREESKLFNATLIIVGLKVFEIYIRQFSGLLRTGFGLILTGLAILGVVYCWSKYRHQIEGKLKEIIR